MEGGRPVEPPQEESWGEEEPKFDKVAIAQRALAVPIAEVVKNHHERIALLEERVCAVFVSDHNYLRGSNKPFLSPSI